jgi:hypothetical protein
VLTHQITFVCSPRLGVITAIAGCKEWPRSLDGDDYDTFEWVFIKEYDRVTPQL